LSAAQKPDAHVAKQPAENGIGRKWAAARLAPKKYGDHLSHDVHGSTTLNYQPAILIKVGDGQATRFEDAPAPSRAWRSTRR